MKIRPAYALLAAVVSLPVWLGPNQASAHIRMTNPPPRTDADNMKTAPCGTQAKGDAPQMVYTAGQQIKVDLLETIDHTGCYQIAIAADDASPFTVLAQKADAADVIQAGGSPRDLTATLPADFTCESCTLQLRQIMLGGACADDQGIDAEPARSNTYFSCADVKITAAAVDAGPGSTSSSSGAASSSGVAPAPIDAGVSAPGVVSPGGDSPGSSGRGGPGSGEEGGCSTSPGSTGSVAALLAVLGLVAVRRRR